MEIQITRREFLRLMVLSSAGAVLAACAPQAAPTAAPAPTTAATAASKASEALTLPIVKEPLTLTYWASLTPNVAATMKSYNEVGCYKELEKRTGMHIEFQHPPIAQEQEQLNLLVASGKYPDVIEWNFLQSFAGGPARALKDGVILRLNDLIDQYAPNFKKVLTDHPDWRKQIVTDEGDIYCFPFLRGDPYLLTFTGPTVRKDWLDKLGLPVPTTVDEWHDMLVAFKTKDPNGNGKADELAFTPWFSEGSRSARGAYVRNFLIGAWGITAEWYQDKGQVKYAPLQPEFKEFLKTIAQWFKEGLIDPDYVSSNQSSVDAKVTGNQLGSLVMNTGSGIGKYNPLLTTRDPKSKLVAAPNVVLKKGDKPLLGHRENVYPGQGSAAITSANKRVVETVKWLDYGYSPEGNMLFNFGIEGVTYTMVSGTPTFTDAVLNDPKLPPAQALAKYARSSFNGPFVQDKRYLEQSLTLPEQKDAVSIWLQASNERLMPPVTPTQDESRKFASVMTDINTRYEETFNKIVTGALPLDAWDQFVTEIKQIGIDDALKIQQAALDRYNKRSI